MAASTNDLSISELSLSLKPFSLLATPIDQEESAVQQPQRNPDKAREEKLQSDIFILKKLNASFELFNEALHDTGSANKCLAAQLEQTDALLEKYVAILSRSEVYSRLIFDENWKGAEADENALEEERQAEERARREAQEQAIRAHREQEKLEREKQERLKAENKERIERDKSERATIRGVRGNRASIGGVRGRPPRADTTTRGIPKRQPSASTRTSGSNIARGTS